ncbi:MAG: aminopeptidase [Pseudomonadota bacterium]
MDPRLTKLADLLVNFSTAAQKGERLLVEAIGVDTLPLVEEIVRVAARKGVFVFHNIHDHTVLRAFLNSVEEPQVAALTQHALAQMKDMDCYIGVRGPSNVAELSDVPQAAMNWYNKYYFDAVHIKQRVAHTRWVVLRYPNHAMAQLAKQPLRAFEDFYYDVCTMDYARMSRAMDPLQALMARTDRVEIKAPGTDLRLSIRGLPVIKCDGKLNIPDGEVYTAPVDGSVQGTITFNAGAIYEGKTFGPIALTFDKGRIVKVDAGSSTAAVEAVLDRDAGARGVGEFALGVNPFITRPMLDTLFDEKIGGSLHMAMGNSYDDCDNGNKSQIHWDLVHIQTPEYGGGEIWFDGTLIRKDGQFVLDELRGLNPDKLRE